MKKLNKLFAILIAVLGVSATAKADTSILKESEGWQKITEIPTNLTDYYYALVDNSNDLMLTMAVGANQGSSYYTMYYKSSVNPLQNKAALWTIEGTNYTFRNTEYTKFALQTEWGAAWHYRTHDQANACEWTATIPTYSLSEACWTIQNGKYPDSGYLGPWSNTVQDGAEVACNKTGDAIGKFQIYAIHKTYCVDVLAPNATNANTVDMTVMMANRDAALPVVGLGGWTTANTITRNTNNGYDGKGGFFEFCNWNASSWEGSMTQTITSLPNGKYIVKAAGQASPTDVVLTLTANGVSTNLNCIGAEGGSISADGTEVTLGSGVAGWQYMTVECVVANGELTITASSTGTAQYRWANIDNFTITYCGKDLTTYENALSSKIEVAKAIDKTKLNTYTSDYLANKITAAENALSDASRTVESLENQVVILDAAINLANGVIPIYSSINELISLCETYAAESYSNVETTDIRTTFTSAISLAKNDANDAESLEALNAVYNTLEAARQEFITVAYPTTGNSFDVTYKILNAEVTSKDNWETNANLASNVDYTSAPDIYALDRWDAGSTNGTTVYAKQTINNLANGVYTLTAMARGNGANMYYVYATSNGVEYKTVVIGGEDTGNPWGLVTVPNIVVANGVPMELGLKGTNNNTWFSVDNFKLYRSYDAKTMQSVLTDLLTGANTMASKPMNATIKGALNSTIQTSDATATDPATLDNMINALNEAMASAESSINDYAKLKKYIDMTAEFTDVTTYETKYNNGEYSTDDVKTVRQELNVMRFNVASHIFTNNIEVTGWEGTMGGKNTSSQHWDGTTTTKYYDNNSWNGTAHSTTTNITLPAGNYVLKAALRSSANTTLRLTVLDKTVDIEGKGDQGYGIDVNGKATFAEEGTYANEDKGRGWEWEFVKFELTEETTVTLTVECDYNGVYGWASFSDITLWMDDATYVAVYGKELDAPLAEAKNLVNTLPMGDAENAALADAITLGEGEISKPAQLNTAVDALKKAVANANDWRSTYNTEKDKLVAALERFETEFNDGANGALRFIVEWDELLAAVAEAACAKDITNSYDRFSNAAAALNAAMDAVFEDYLKYEMLEDYTSVIGNADCASNDAWPGSGRVNDTKEHWSGTEKTYFKQNHENGAARTQTVTLPKSGTYLLKAAVRAVEAASYVDIIINGKSHKIMGAHGRTGGTIATDGTEWESVAAGIEDGKTFANDNKGFGWVYQYIYFDAKAGENTIAISLSNTNNNREANVGGMMLYYLRPNYTIKEDNIVKHYGEYTESITAVHTTHDVTNATMSNLAVNVTATPNALIIANEGQVSNANNVVVDGTAASLVLNDGGYAFNTTADFTATALNYAREFTKDTWLTVCLPFTYAIPENVKVETLSEIDTDTKTFTFDEVKGRMEANKPYIIKNSTETAALFASFGNVEVEATPAAMNVTIIAENSTHGGEFIGTYTTMSSTVLMEDGTYDILFFGTDGQLYYLSSGITTKNITIKPFRAYIRLPKGAINWSDGQQARVRHRAFGEETDIENTESTFLESEIIYDLMGRKVTTMEKGKMYIVNGKKVIR